MYFVNMKMMNMFLMEESFWTTGLQITFAVLLWNKLRVYYTFVHSLNNS